MDLTLAGADGRAQRMTYAYDRAGNRIQATDGKVELSSTYDPMSRITGETRRLLTEGTTYTTGYRYNAAGNLTGIQYPCSADWLESDYNQMDELTSITGYIESAPTYEPGGLPSSITAANGVTTSYTRDANSRIEGISAVGPKGQVLSLNYTYDAAGNITQRNNNTYVYDELNRLTSATIQGIFRDEVSGKNGYAMADFFGDKGLNFSLGATDQVALDYAAASIGTDLESIVAGLSRLYLKKVAQGGTLPADRLHAGALDIYVAGDDAQYAKLDPAQWTFSRTPDGQLQIDLDQTVSARYVKIHSKFDDRNEDGTFVDKSTFRNALNSILTLEKQVSEAHLAYEYDAVGNRTREDDTRLDNHTKDYLYYANSDRLLTDEEYAFTYDADGNLIRKGNRYSISGDTVTFTATTGYGVRYWEYGYDLLNRLAWVQKNGVRVAEYTYDPNGFRVVSKHLTTQETTHYIPNLSQEALFEKETASGKARSYVWWRGQHLARAEGDPTDPATTRYFYHLDHEGSLMAATDGSGAIAWSNDYQPFGEGIEQGDSASTGAISEAHGFAGKAYDGATGLYYYNARWYDAELGRFVTADDWPVEPDNPLTLNTYSYAHDNPLIFTDPTGHKVWYVHGTWSNKGIWPKALMKRLAGMWEDPNYESFSWSGGNRDRDRRSAAERLAQEILDWKESHPNDPVRIVGHSHGGNVGILAANIVGDKVKVDTLVTIATPVREYRITTPNVGKHIQVYSTQDPVQSGGGIRGFFGIKDFPHKGGEWGPAGRKFPNAINVEVPSFFGPNPFGLPMHSWLYERPTIQEYWIVQMGLAGAFDREPE